jgi:hypothetical protein
MEITGKLYAKGEIKTFGANGFQKQEIVIETSEQYPQKIMIEFTQDKTDLTHPFEIGDDVKVGINIRGREWQSPLDEMKYFNSIQGWRIERV